MEELKRKSEELRKYINPVIFNFWLTCPLAKVEDAESQLKYLIEQGAYRSIAMFAEYSLLCLMLGKSVKLDMIVPEVEWACVWD